VPELNLDRRRWTAVTIAVLILTALALVSSRSGADPLASRSETFSFLNPVRRAHQLRFRTAELGSENRRASVAQLNQFRKSVSLVLPVETKSS
jgi:hypothetical protein